MGCIFIAACTQAPDVSRFQYTPNLSAMRETAKPSGYRVMHSFGAGHDGYHPEAGLTYVDGLFYGTTELGGLYDKGTVFKIASNGSEKVLHSFGRGTDGSKPYGRVTDIDGTLYGTTGYGGDDGYGTFFSITTSGRERVVHDFGDNGGELPSEDLIANGHTLYGETELGGYDNCGLPTEGCGTIFSVTTAGREKVLHKFGEGTDGQAPAAGVTAVNGSLYGTTIHGGVFSVGVVFRLTAGGKERVLHSFRGHPDGVAPAYASLVYLKGKLYGTTEGGGAHNYGTIYSITTTGVERVVHSFDRTDGRFPAASLIDVGGTLYGTTTHGGAYDLGTVFSVTTAGTERVLHSFGEGNDGVNPGAGLTYENGTLYGTTQIGGVYGEGTVFALSVRN